MGKGSIKAPNAGTFNAGSAAGGKVALGGKITKGKDLRSGPGKNQGKMPKTI